MMAIAWWEIVIVAGGLMGVGAVILFAGVCAGAGAAIVVSRERGQREAGPVTTEDDEPGEASGMMILHEAGRKLDGRDVTCYVNPEHISAVRRAVKHSMDDDAGSEIVLVEGTTIRVVETPRQVNEQRLGP